MKRLYIKPVSEELSSEVGGLLCVSNDTNYQFSGEGGAQVPGSGGGGVPPKPQGAREFGDDFFEEEEF